MVSSFAAEATNKAGLRMGVAATYLFLLIYSIGIDVAGVVFYSGKTCLVYQSWYSQH
jgi:hypothetical protein